MAKSLLQEAIAEAKQLREAAIQNATKQLEENLTPSIKEMLAQKLEEELSLNEIEEEENPLNEDSNSGFKKVKLKEADNESKSDQEPEEDDAPVDDAAADADAAAEDADAAAEDADDAAADAEEDADDAAADAEDSEDSAIADDETPLKDITLGDLRTLIQDIVAAGAAPAPGGDLGADMEPGDVEGMGDEVPAGDLAATDSASPDPTAAAPGEEPAADPTADPDAAADDDDEIDISEILKELENEEKCPECGKDKEHCICKENQANDIMPQNQNGKEHHKEPNENGISQDDEGLQKENQELKAKVAQLEEGLAKVTKTLNDVNLLNGKLVYTTRLLNKENLTESQKANVIKTLDSAKSTKEVKSLYRTLLEGLKPSKKVVTESRRGSASRPAGGSTASTILEGDEMVRRFQELAGIIKG